MARCNYAGRRGQCTLAAIDGSEFCARHSNESKRMWDYHLKNAELAAIQQAQKESDEETGLEAEVRLLRGMIQDRLNLVTSKAEHERALSVVAPWLDRVAKLRETSEKLKRSAHTAVGKAALFKLGTEIIEIITEEFNHVPGRDEIIDRVARRIANAIAQIRNEDD